MSTVTLELERVGDFVVMYEIKWRTGGSWICTTRDLAEEHVKINQDDAISITIRHIIYR